MNDLEYLLNRRLYSFPIEDNTVSNNQTLLITGAGGSIGRALTTYGLQVGLNLVLLDISEIQLAKLHQEYTLWNRDARVAIYLGDAGDKNLLKRIFNKHHFDIVVHAAAYKHLPLLEENSEVAYWNNVEVSKILFQFCMQVGVDQFVFISSDKAVNPSSVLGHSKKKAEKALMGLYREDADIQLKIVRFGNVLFSSGSVLEVVERAIAEQKTIKITHREVSRYFFTMNEICEFVFHVIHQKSDIPSLFVPPEPDPVKVLDLVDRYCTLRKVDFTYKIIGLCNGEKLQEELLSNAEKEHAFSSKGGSSIPLLEISTQVTDL